MEKKVILHGKEFTYEDADYGVIKGFHERKTRFVPYEISELEAMTRNNTRIGTKHNLRVYHGLIDYVLRRPDEFKFSAEETASLERTRSLFHRMYTTLDDIVAISNGD